jgi:hypothetical protein
MQAETSDRGSSRDSDDERTQIMGTCSEYERPVSCEGGSSKCDSHVQFSHSIPGRDCASVAEDSVEVLAAVLAQGNDYGVQKQKVQPVRRFVLWKRSKESTAAPILGGCQEVSEVEGLFQQF